MMIVSIRRRQSSVLGSKSPFVIVFHITERNLFVIQIRSQPKEVWLSTFMNLKGVADRFAEELMDFVTSLRPQLFVVISSGDSTFFDLQSAQKLYGPSRALP